MALYGLGGIGKTQIAVQYAYDRQEDYSLVWWVRAEDPATLALDYAKLGEELQLPFEANSSELAGAVKRWLETNNGWLLVFDNAEKPEDLQDYLPQRNGSTLITSRNPNWRAWVKPEPMKVQELPHEEAADFLVRRSGDKDREGALKLAKELGYLPLALEQAAAYIEATGSSCAKYLELFQTSHPELLEKHKPFDYRDPVATTWKISFDSLRKQCRAAADLMELCAFFAPNAIPFDLFTEHTEHLPRFLTRAVEDPVQWDKVKAGLKRYSLAELDQDSLSFHRLVQMVVRNEMRPAERKRKAAAAVSLISVAYAFKSEDLETWPRADQLLPHALHVAEYSHIERVDDEPTSHLLNEMGSHLRMLGQFLDAKANLERALEIAEKVYGPDHPEVATDLNNLGLALQDLGDLPGAKANLERALEIRRAVLGDDHPKTKLALENLKSLESGK